MKRPGRESNPGRPDERALCSADLPPRGVSRPPPASYLTLLGLGRDPVGGVVVRQNSETGS